MPMRALKFAVHIDERAGFVSHFSYFFYAGFKDPQRVGHGEHEHGCPVTQVRFEVCRVHPAVGTGFDIYRVKPQHGRGGRVGAVSGVGTDYIHALILASLGEVGFGYQQACKLAMRAGGRLESESVHRAQGAKAFLQIIEHLKRPLRGLVVRQRMKISETLQGRRLFVDLRIVLHSAGAQRIKVGVYGKVNF